MKSPFKFLDAYQLEDRDVFFGREEEISTLYNMVTQNRLVLVYGPSGTGKTSLIQCGLASRFDITDWYPLSIRRQHNLNQSLKQQLQAASGQEEPAGSASEALENVYIKYLRPVYLIFDQLEEIFILGTHEEQETFIHTIRSFLETKIPCRILFVIREEYLAHLYAFERVVPSLYDRRLRVEPMSMAKVKDVLEGSFKVFNIRVQEPTDASYSLIIDNVSGKKTGIGLPYLQVYLDILYREDFDRTYPQGQPMAGEWPPLEFTRPEIQSFGQIENVLERFLQEQREALQKYLHVHFPDTQRDAVDKLLDAFVSEEGTKRPIRFTLNKQDLVVEPRWEMLFAHLTPEALGTCCRMLEQARLLHFDDDQMELAHDTLATIIDQRRSAEQRQLFEIRRRIATGFKEHIDTNGEYFFDSGQLARIEPFVSKIALEPDWKKFIDKSYAEADRRENAERERVERELRLTEEKLEAEKKEKRLTEEKLEAEKKEKRRRTIFLWIIGAVAGIAIVAMVIAFIQQGLTNVARLEAVRNAEVAQKAKTEAESNLTLANKNAEDARQAEKMARESAILARNSEIMAQKAVERAEQNFRDATAAKVVADSISRQLQLETGATEEQKAKAEENAAKAEKSAKDAEAALQKAIEAQQEVNKQTATVVDGILKEAKADIFHLEYNEAAQILGSAAALGQHKPDVAHALMEIAFYYGESGRLTDALTTLGHIAALDSNYIPPAQFSLSDTTETRKAILKALRSVDSDKVDDLNKQYYPFLISIPGDTFVFGCDKNTNCAKLPRVRLSTYRLAETETTVWQYGLFCAATGKDIEATQEKPWGDLRGDDPVVHVTWFDAIAYANWLSKQNGLTPAYLIESVNKKSQAVEVVSFQPNTNGYRLPTDTEWEFAARGGSASDYSLYSGSDTLKKVGWYKDNSGARTHRVASFRQAGANRLGLYDMTGNVWEWCWDWFVLPYQPKNDANPVGPKSGIDRVIRGGSWRHSADEARLTYRASFDPDEQAAYIGFRVAKKE